MDQQFLENWLKKVLATTHLMYELLPGDASLRHYYRVQVVEQRYLLMICPSITELEQFIKVANGLKAASVLVPTIYHVSLEHKMALISDFGDELYEKIPADKLKAPYLQAIDSIFLLQQSNLQVPVFTADYMEKQLQIFYNWYFKKQSGVLEVIFSELIKEISKIPKTVVHFDYHCRNLLQFAGQVAVIDFQDAVMGPITYDLISLTQDYYKVLPTDIADLLIDTYYQKLQANYPISKEQFQYWLDIVALQRHLKNLGVFARLRDFYHKPRYASYLPQVLNYIKAICTRHSYFQPIETILCAP